MKTVQERFEAKFMQSDGCWEWTAGKDRDGYGRLWFAGRAQLAHRVSYQLYVGEIPDDLQVLHHCDNSCCVRPDHLFLGTIADNMHDRDSKGRRIALAGEKCPNAKLNEKQVIAIRARYAAGEHQRALGREYGTTQSAISLIVLRRNWAKTA